MNAKSDITKVVLGLTPLSYEFDEASRTLTLRRATLAQLPSGTYTVTVETQSGGSVQAVDLTVSDTTPAGVNALTAAYRSASPAAVRFAVPMQGRSVRSITVAQDGRAYTLNAGTDYFAASDGHFARGECARAVRDLGRVHGLHGGALGQFHLAARGGLHLKEAGRARSLRCSASGREMSLHFIRFSSKL